MTFPGLTDEQIEIKRTRFSGSSTSAYLGYNPWDSPLSAWRKNRGEIEWVETDDMAGGNAFEDGIALMVEREMGIKTYKPDSVFHPEYPEAIVVHYDRLCDEEKIGIQIKNHWPFIFKHSYKGPPVGTSAGNALIPLYLNIQCQIEMMVARAAFGEGWGDWWILAPHFGGAKPRLYWIRRHTKFQQALLEKGLAFWRRHLDPTGPQDRPVNAPWVGAPEKYQKPVRVEREELLAAPIPFGGDEPPALDLNIPFMKEGS